MAALTLVIPVMLEVWAAAFGDRDTARVAQVVWGIVCAVGAMQVAWLIVTKSPAPDAPRAELASWCKGMWWLPWASAGMATPFVFMIGALRSGRRWLWLATVASFDLVVCSVIANGPSPTPPGLPSVVTTISAFALWVLPPVLMLGLWRFFYKTPPRRRRGTAATVGDVTPVEDRRHRSRLSDRIVSAPGDGR